jgi:hypothetical protein
LDTTCEGTGGEGMIKGAMHYGLQVTTRSGLNCDDLRGYLLEGYTCILSIQSWGNYDESTDMSKVWDDGHYVVLVGFEGQDVYLMDPAVAGAYRKMTIRELLDCWHDYADDGGEDWNAAIILRGETPSPAVRPVRVE